MDAGTRLVLASASATRAQILEGAGVPFTARPADVDEAALKARLRAEEASADAAATALATAKALAVSGDDQGALVLGADQILVADGCWFDKPADLTQARNRLRDLRGRAHDLVTAVVAVRDGAVIWRHVETARLVMRRFSDAFLEAYLSAAGPTVLSSVGAYRIEGPGAQLFARVDGDYFAILGLPLWPLLDFLRECGVLER